MTVKIGLLPLYLALYDEVAPAMREEIDTFYQTIAARFRAMGIAVETSPVCRIENEFNKAVSHFEQEQVQALVTLHLAYSPSLESLPALLGTNLPIVILNTTPDTFFGPGQDPSRISYNHGIHGVQDMCSMLLRNNRTYHIQSGHWESSDVMERVIDTVRAVSAAETFRGSRIGLLGSPFRGMGDFQVTPEDMKEEYNIDVVPFGSDRETGNNSITENEIDEEIAALRTYVDTGDVPEDILRGNAAISIQLRKWVSDEQLSAFTCNFLSVNTGSPIDRVPFLFAASGMYEGIGYAGEGDTLTAALTGALLKLNPESTFTEIFCPDWENDRLFLSHMGEINPRICGGTARLQAKPYTYSEALPPVFSTGRCMPGEAHLINLVPLSPTNFRLLVCPVTVHEAEGDKFGTGVRGWISSSLPAADFLTEYSLNGGTHHSGMIYGEKTTVLEAFGKQLGWDVRVIG